MKVSPECVAMRERKAWKNRCLASGIATRLLLAVCNFLGVARRAREKNSDRWSNVLARRPENVGFSRGHCTTTVPWPGGLVAWCPVVLRKIFHRARKVSVAFGERKGWKT